MILHFSHIGLTDGRTFTGLLFLFENLGGGSFAEALETVTVAATSPRSDRQR
jgi:hypothetical protein